MTALVEEDAGRQREQAEEREERSRRQDAPGRLVELGEEEDEDGEPGRRCERRNESAEEESLPERSVPEIVRVAPALSASARERDILLCRKGGDRIATKEEKLEMEGEIVEAFPNGMFKVQLDNGHEALGYTAGKMRRFRIKIFPGDRVKLELSPYDLSRGRIVYRFK